MNKKIPYIILGILVFSSFLLLFRSGAPGVLDATIIPHGVSEIAFGDKPSRYDFGTVSMAKGKIAHNFVVANFGDAGITVEKAMTSCMCTAALILLEDGGIKGPFGMPGHGLIPRVDASVAPGEKITVRVIFDPAAHGPAGIGRVERDILLETDEGEYVFGFTAQVTP